MSGFSNYHALDASKCIGCTHCMKSCPTEAIRVVNGLAVIDYERCVYCGQCHRVCPTRAFYVEQDDLAMIRSFKYRVILFPSIMIGQFPEKYNEDQIYDGLKKVGFTHIYEVEQPMQVLIDSINQVLEDTEMSKPAISIYCPAHTGAIPFLDRKFDPPESASQSCSPFCHRTTDARRCKT